MALIAGTAKVSSPSHSETHQVLDQAKPVLVGVQHLAQGFGSVEWDLHNGLGGQIANTGESKLFGNRVRQPMLVHKVFETGSSSPKVIVQVLVGAPDLAEVGKLLALLRHG